MDASAKAFFLLLLALVLMAAFSPSSCPEVEQDPAVTSKIQELQELKQQARNLATEVTRLQQTQESLATKAASGGRRLHALGPPPDFPPEAPRDIPYPITKAEALNQVKQTPACRDAINRLWDTQTFTSQYSQDWFLFTNYFHNKKGFYLDIGANQYMKLSNTWFLDECLGWDGICVEADPGLGDLLRKHRTCKVVNTCVDSSKRTMALQAAGIAVGHIVALEDKNDRGKVLTCTTLADIVKDHNLKHIDFLTVDVEDHEPHVLQTLPEADELTIDMILLENEKDVSPTRCHMANLLRFPFWNRGYGLVGFHGLPHGDDLWVRLGQPHLWRHRIHYARNAANIEDRRLNAYKTIQPAKFNTPEIIAKFMKKDLRPY